MKKLITGDKSFSKRNPHITLYNGRVKVNPQEKFLWVYFYILTIFAPISSAWVISWLTIITVLSPYSFNISFETL